MATVDRIKGLILKRKDNWNQYLKFFFEANGIKEDAKKCPTFSDSY